MTQQARGARSVATLEEVAARAGVSRATASRVLRGESNVSASAREAVHRAAREIHYRPNRVARSLVTGRSESIAFVVSESEERMFAEPFFLGMLRAAQETIAAADLQLMFTVAATEDERERFVDYAAGGHIDGALLLSMHGNDDLQQRLEEVGVPTVLSGRPPDPAAALYHVDADNVHGGRLATSYLLGQGRRSIGTVTGFLDMCAGQDRLEGYRLALQDAGIAPDDSLVMQGGFATSEGYEATLRLLERRPDIDALVMASDLSAIGAVRALRRLGRKVGDEVAVIGFDDIRAAREHEPPLTTIRQPISDLGATLARLLLTRLSGESPEEYGVLLPVELVLRATA